jgi:hypothetical protein
LHFVCEFDINDSLGISSFGGRSGRSHKIEIMLLVPPNGALRLADVFPSCLAALTGVDNALGLAPVKHAAVLLVDGLGAHNLSDHRGHAPWLSKAWATRGLIADVGFPSTTASALTTLTTGVLPGEHGIVGYSVRDPESGSIINHLKDWHPTVDPDTWQRSRTVFEVAAERGISSLSQGEPRFAKSDFTKAVWRGARFEASASLSEQFGTMHDFFADTNQGLAYLYWPALDRTGHGSGSESDSWLHRLEELDEILSQSVETLGPDTGLVITADHGMVDVPLEAKIFVDEPSLLLEGVVAWAGEPRAPQLYVASPSGVAPLVRRWREKMGDKALVLTRDELIDTGVLGPIASTVAQRLGDIVILCREAVAVYHSPTASANSVAMTGQHGSITPREREVPVIAAGAWR